jgi:hypothetical protein
MTRGASLTELQARAGAVIDALHTRLAQQARQLLAELALVSSGSITTYAPTGRSGAGPRGPSTGDQWPAHHQLLDRIANATSARDVEEALEWGRKELNALRRAPENPAVQGETPAERAARLVRDGEGLSPSEAATRLAVPTRELIAARAAADRDPWDGWPLRPTVELTPDERQQRARRLAAQGVPATVIAQRLAASVTTIRRDLGRRAA